MKREIKFRGLTDTEAPTWVYGSLVNNLWSYSEYSKYEKGSSVCEILVPGGSDCWEDIESYEMVLTVIPNSVGQYTGRKDKTGKEIYEGDIIEDFIGNKAVIEWGDSGWLVLFDVLAQYLDDVERYATVIGNKFENPELITP